MVWYRWNRCHPIASGTGMDCLPFLDFAVQALRCKFEVRLRNLHPMLFRPQFAAARFGRSVPVNGSRTVSPTNENIPHEPLDHA